MDRINHLWADIASLTPRLVAVNWMACAHTLDALQFKKVTRERGRVSSLRLCLRFGREQGSLRLRAAGVPLEWDPETALDQHEERFGGSSAPKVSKQRSPALSAKFGPRFHTRASAFAWVCKHGHLGMCRLLREWGMRVQEIRDDMGQLATAARRGHVCIFQELKQWTTPRDDSPDHLTVEDLRYEINLILENATYGGNLDLCQFLKDWRDKEPLPNGTWDRLTIDDVRGHENGALGGAAEGGHVHILQFLKDWRDGDVVTYPAGSCAPDGDRLTIEDVRNEETLALRVAARNGHAGVLEFLKAWVDESGERLTLKDVRAEDNSALMWAAQQGHVDVLVVLKNWVDASGDRLTLADVRTDNNYALRCAARKGHLGVCQFLKDWRDPDTGNLPASETSLGLRDLHDFQVMNPAPGSSEFGVPKERDYNALQLAEKNGHTQLHKFLKDWETQEIAYNMGAAIVAAFSPLIDPALPSMLQTLFGQLLPQ